jgi:hypothetical protein
VVGATASSALRPMKSSTSGDGNGTGYDRAGSAEQRCYRRAVPVTTMSTCRPPHPEQTSRSRQSRTDVFAPYEAAISAGSGSTWRPLALHQTINRTFAFAALPSVIGGPGGDFMSLPL